MGPCSVLTLSVRTNTKVIGGRESGSRRLNQENVLRQKGGKPFDLKHSQLKASSAGELRSRTLVRAFKNGSVSLQFVVPKFETQPGQSICVVGGKPFLGNWSTANSVPLSWCPGHQWTSSEVNVACDDIQDLEFKVVLLDGRQGGAPAAIWEPGENRKVEAAAAASAAAIAKGDASATLALFCDWGRGRSHLDALTSALLTSMSSPPPPPPPIAAQPLAKASPFVGGPSRASVRVCVPVTGSGLGSEDRILLVGSVPVLGSWSAARGLVLTRQPASPHVWQAEADLPWGVKIEAKIVSQSGSRWESGPNRSFTLEAPASGGASEVEGHRRAARALLVLHGGFFGCNQTVLQPVLSRRADVGAESGSGSGSAASGGLPSPPPLAFRFTVPFLQMAAGHSLKLVGSPPQMGSWDPAAGLPLKCNPGSFWTSELVEISPPKTGDGSSLVEFKIVMDKGNGSYSWESGPNRKVDLHPAQASVDAAFGGADMQVPDAAAGLQALVHCMWGQVSQDPPLVAATAFWEAAEEAVEENVVETTAEPVPLIAVIESKSVKVEEEKEAAAETAPLNDDDDREHLMSLLLAMTSVALAGGQEETRNHDATTDSPSPSAADEACLDGAVSSSVATTGFSENENEASSCATAAPASASASVSESTVAPSSSLEEIEEQLRLVMKNIAELQKARGEDPGAVVEGGDVNVTWSSNERGEDESTTSDDHPEDATAETRSNSNKGFEDQQIQMQKMAQSLELTLEKISKLEAALLRQEEAPHALAPDGLPSQISAEPLMVQSEVADREEDAAAAAVVVAPPPPSTSGRYSHSSATFRSDQGPGLPSSVGAVDLKDQGKLGEEGNERSGEALPLPLPLAVTSAAEEEVKGYLQRLEQRIAVAEAELIKGASAATVAHAEKQRNLDEQVLSLQGQLRQKEDQLESVKAAAAGARGEHTAALQASITKVLEDTRGLIEKAQVQQRAEMEALRASLAAALSSPSTLTSSSSSISATTSLHAVDPSSVAAPYASQAGGKSSSKRGRVSVETTVEDLHGSGSQSLADVLNATSDDKLTNHNTSSSLQSPEISSYSESAEREHWHAEQEDTAAWSSMQLYNGGTSTPSPMVMSAASTPTSRASSGAVWGDLGAQLAARLAAANRVEQILTAQRDELRQKLGRRREEALRLQEEAAAAAAAAATSRRLYQDAFAEVEDLRAKDKRNQVRVAALEADLAATSLASTEAVATVKAAAAAAERQLTQCVKTLESRLEREAATWQTKYDVAVAELDELRQRDARLHSAMTRQKLALDQAQQTEAILREEVGKMHAASVVAAQEWQVTVAKLRGNCLEYERLDEQRAKHDEILSAKEVALAAAERAVERLKEASTREQNSVEGILASERELRREEQARYYQLRELLLVATAAGASSKDAHHTAAAAKSLSESAPFALGQVFGNKAGEGGGSWSAVTRDGAAEVQKRHVTELSAFRMALERLRGAAGAEVVQKLSTELDRLRSDLESAENRRRAEVVRMEQLYAAQVADLAQQHVAALAQERQQQAQATAASVEALRESMSKEYREDGEKLRKSFESQIESKTRELAERLESARLLLGRTETLVAVRSDSSISPSPSATLPPVAVAAVSLPLDGGSKSGHEYRIGSAYTSYFPALQQEEREAASPLAASSPAASRQEVAMSTPRSHPVSLENEAAAVGHRILRSQHVGAEAAATEVAATEAATKSRRFPGRSQSPKTGRRRLSTTSTTTSLATSSSRLSPAASVHVGAGRSPTASRQTAQDPSLVARVGHVVLGMFGLLETEEQPQSGSGSGAARPFAPATETFTIDGGRKVAGKDNNWGGPNAVLPSSQLTGMDKLLSANNVVPFPLVPAGGDLSSAAVSSSVATGDSEGSEGEGSGAQGGKRGWQKAGGKAPGTGEARGRRQWSQVLSSSPAMASAAGVFFWTQVVSGAPN